MKTLAIISGTITLGFFAAAIVLGVIMFCKGVTEDAVWYGERAMACLAVAAVANSVASGATGILIDSRDKKELT